MGKAHQLVAKYWMVCSENIYTKIWIEKFVFVYFCSICRCNKQLMRLKEMEGGLCRRFSGDEKEDGNGVNIIPKSKT